jgi:ATP-binding cassette, subfamily B, bacterial IrtB/YbtQ
MIRTLLRLVPADRRGTVTAYGVLTALSVVLRAAGTVLLVPLLAALFGDNPGDAWAWLGWLSAVTLVGWLVDTTTARLGFDLGFAILDSTQHDMADRLPEVSLSWFDQDHTATARQAIAATGPELAGTVVNLLTPLVGAILLPGAIAVALLTVSVPLGLAALAGVAVLFGALWLSGRLGRRADTVAGQTNTALTERIIEFARTQQALRSARRVEPARSLVGGALEAQHGATLRLLTMQIPGQLLFGLASQIALITFAAMTAWLTVRGELAVPEAVALIVVLARFLDPFTVVSELAPAIESTRTTLGRIQAVLDAPLQDAGTTPGGHTAPEIEFADVRFGYGDEPVLDGLSFTLQPATTTAIVGPSGSGKSTILALIAGLHQPVSGRVSLDGVDIAALHPDARRGAVSVVFQHPYLFDGSLRDNVLVGDPAADPDAVADAMRRGRLDELIGRLPDGDATRVGEGGAALSGGERQRVSIARALLKPAPVLLVDEATSALDTENEAAVVDALTADPRPRTRVIVAHRLASIRHADRVLFVEGGRIVEDGTVDELLSAGGRFEQFWHQQHAASDWRIAAR